jgi:hypothetical protein
MMLTSRKGMLSSHKSNTDPTASKKFIAGIVVISPNMASIEPSADQ